MIGLRLHKIPLALIPLYVMSVPAGPPAPAEDYIEERIDLSEYLAPHPTKTFLIRVDGDSMIDAGICPGDLLVVERSSEACNGDIVIALINGQFTVKELRRLPNRLWLVSANKNLPPARHEPFSIWGIVKFAIHKV